MLKQSQRLKLSQTISPQQIQFIKLLQIPTMGLEQRIKEELEKNPVLEEGRAEDEKDEDFGDQQQEEREQEQEKSDIDLDEYIKGEEYDHRTRLPQSPDDEEQDYAIPVMQYDSLYDRLEEQLNMLSLSEHERLIGEHIIGSIDEDGYLRRPLRAMTYDMSFRHQISVQVEEVEEVLKEVQKFDPAGIAARDLQECLMLQLERKTISPAVRLAIAVIAKHFEEFKKKNFSKLKSQLGVDGDELKEAYEIITKLNPKPGESLSGGGHPQEYITPDFLVREEEGKFQIRLNGRNAPDLRVSRNYLNMYKQYQSIDKETRKKDPTVKETLNFVKGKIESARWFIDALRQRQFTLLNTMEAILNRQESFFRSEGDEKQLSPMILKDIADDIQMDISTISRVANSKYVQTDFGIYPLKYFFSEGIETTDGETVSNREVKRALQEVIEVENKRKPLSDDRIAKELKEKGYSIARRTVAKYREQLNIPPARLRKEI